MQELTVRPQETLPADQEPVLVYLAGLNEPARRTQRGALETAAGVFTDTQVEYRGRMVYKDDPLIIPWHELRYQHLNLLRSTLAENFSPSRCNSILAAVRGVLKAAWMLGKMTAEDYHRAKAVENVKGERLPAGRNIAAGEIGALLNGASPRDAAMVALLYSCGLRRAELAGLELADYKDGELRVRGKGNKERLVYVVNGAKDALDDWLELRGDEPGPLFLPVNKAGRIEHKRLTDQAIYYVLRRRAEQAGVDDLTPHDFRRTFVGDLLDAGADISTVQKLAGHADVTTTQRYDRRPEEAKRKAVELLHVPYTRSER